MSFSPYDDPELQDWIKWASEQGNAPMFVRTIAEAASIENCEQYALMRPVLLELKRESVRRVVI